MCSKINPKALKCTIVMSDNNDWWKAGKRVDDDDKVLNINRFCV